MTKEQLAQKIAKEIYKGKGKLESFHAFQCIRSYFYDLSMDDLEGIAGQYGINIQLDKRVPNNPAKAERTKIATIPIAITLDMLFI